MRNTLAIGLTFLLLLAVLFSASALAQQQVERPTEIYQKITNITFTEGDVIEAPLDRPDTDIVFGRPGTPRESLIKLRENMREKVLASAKAL